MSKVKSQNSKVKVAFFDIDGTIFRSSLLIELVNELIVLGIFPAKATEEISPQKIAWRNRSGGKGGAVQRKCGLYEGGRNGDTRFLRHVAHGRR